MKDTLNRWVTSTITSSLLVLLVACGGGSSSGDVEIDDTNNETPTNSTPIADAGDDASVNVNTSVTLDASGSSDADGDSLTYSWTISSAPSGSSAQIDNASASSASIVPDVAGLYEVSLVVNDGTADSAIDSLTITAIDTSGDNIAPTAIAGDNQSVVIGANVTLDASSSYDLNGDTLTYAWTIDSKPDNSDATLNSSDGESTSFTADLAGDYSVSLVANDGELDSVSDSVTITASTANVDITDAEFGNRSGDCLSYIGSYFSNVTDIQRSMAFSGDIVISNSGNNCSISSNNIPNHDFNDASASFATNVSEQNEAYTFTTAPSFATQSSSLQLGQSEVIMLNGVVLDILPAACYGVGGEPLGREKIGCGGDQIENPWRYDPMSPLNGFGTDEHNAHVQPDGSYHYHGNPMAMFVQDCSSATSASPVIGFAADGFPVYGSCITDPDSGAIREVESSYALKDNGGPRQEVSGYTTPVSGVGDIASANYDGQFRGDWEYQNEEGDLDECNGMTVDGQYGYYVTNTFPWVVNCFKGEPNDSFSAMGAALQNKLHSH